MNKAQSVASSSFRIRWLRMQSEMSVSSHQAVHLPHVSFYIYINLFFNSALLCLAFKFPLKWTLILFYIAAPLAVTATPASSLTPQCPGNQVMQENSTDCGCPSGMVMDGDNCTCPVGFTLEGAAECKGVKATETEEGAKCLVTNKTTD